MVVATGHLGFMQQLGVTPEDLKEALPTGDD